MNQTSTVIDMEESHLPSPIENIFYFTWRRPLLSLPVVTMLLFVIHNVTRIRESHRVSSRVPVVIRNVTGIRESLRVSSRVPVPIKHNF